MYLKEAFRYQNFINRLISQTMRYLSFDKNVTKITQEHMRKKVNPDAENEIIDMTTMRPFDYEVNNLIRFLEKLMEDKEALTVAISRAKAGCAMDIDAEIANNKSRQSVVSTLNRMAAIKPSEKITRATDYKFNAEGNQVPYTYEVKEVSVIDFDRNRVKAIAKETAARCDEVSANIDKIMVELVVDYTPWYSINDSYEDVMEQFLKG